ncbi:MAG: F0F1 ATP synthase subunit A [Clostridiaceae bacterium]
MNLEGILIHIGNCEFLIHQSIIIWLGILIIVGILLVWAGSRIKKADPTAEPKGVVLIFETLGDIAKGVIGGNLNEKTWKYLPFMGTVMFCMVISNLAGLLGLQPPTSNLSVNATLALMMVCLIHGTDIKLHGIKGKLKSWCDPLPILFPLNIIGDLAFPLSLTLRLFGNMLGGTIIITLLYSMIKALMPYTVVAFAVTPLLHMYFDVFTAFMQTYIFFTLASFFLSEAQ